MLNECTIALISHATKVMLKNFQASLHQYMNHEIPDVKLDLEKAEEPEIKLPTCAGSLKKQEFQKNIYFCFIDYAKDLHDPDNHEGVITHSPRAGRSGMWSQVGLRKHHYEQS